MVPRLLTRALVALAVPALLAPAVSAPAVAAPAKGPEVPTVEQVARIYPQLAEATAEVASEKVRALGPNCKEGKPIPGASATSAFYLVESDDPTQILAAPMVLVGAFRFRTERQASSYFTGIDEAFTECAVPTDDEEGGPRITFEKIRFRLGDERVGYVMTSRFMMRKSVTQQLIVRSGKTIVLAGVLGAGKRWTVKHAVRLTALGLRTAR
jgi:hypothetical protein